MSRRPSRAVPQAIRRVVAIVTEPLEPRQLFAATVIQPLANTFGDPGTTSGAIDLAASFQDPAAGVVRLTTPSGTIDIKTFDQDAPLNAAQFVGIANSGKYNGTYFRRAVISPTPFVLQGGSFYTDDTEVSGVSPVKSEPNGDRHNVRGTVAFARVPATDQSGQPIPGGGPDSATSGFFFNLSDNSANLDNQNGGFTVLGQVLGNGMQVVDALAAIPDGQAKTSRLITTAAQVPDLAFNVSSTNPTLVNPQLAGNSLVLQYGSGTGSAQVTVTATDVDGNMVMSTFTAGVGQLDITVGGPGGARSVNFADADGTASTVSLKGAGAANVRLTGMGLAQTNNKGVVTVSGASILLNSVGVTGSKGSTAVTITGAGGGDGVVALGGLTTDGPARSVVARGVNLTGSLTTGGALRMLDLGASNLATITLGGAATGGATAITIGSATDTNILSNLNIKSLKGNTFVSTGNTFGLITAPGMGTITMTGNFAEDVALSGRIKSMKIGGNLTGEIIADGIGAVNVVGNLDNARLNLTATPGGRALASLKVAGGINSSTIRSNAGIGPITAVSMNGATIFAGVNSGVTTLPTTAADFADVAATITSVKVATFFANSNIAARNLGKMTLGTVQLTNGGVPFGLAADKIAAVTGQTGPGLTFNLKKLDTPDDVTQQAPGLNLMDARITLV